MLLDLIKKWWWQWAPPGVPGLEVAIERVTDWFLLLVARGLWTKPEGFYQMSKVFMDVVALLTNQK